MNCFRFLIFFATVFYLSSCDTYDQAYYERISKIKIPGTYKVIEAYDNGQFYTVTVFKSDKDKLLRFIGENKLEKLEVVYPSQFLGETGLKKYKPDFNNLADMYYVRGQRGRNSWFYIVDIKSNLLWAEIQYPDFAGD